MTAKEIARLAKRRPDVIDNGKAYRVHRLVDFFLDDLEVDKVITRTTFYRVTMSLSCDSPICTTCTMKRVHEEGVSHRFWTHERRASHFGGAGVGGIQEGCQKMNALLLTYHALMRLLSIKLACAGFVT